MMLRQFSFFRAGRVRASRRYSPRAGWPPARRMANLPVKLSH